MKNKALIFFLLISTSLYSQDRVALIIGNGAYAGNPLKNPVNDAMDMSSALEELGFYTITLTNANRRQIITAIHNFGRYMGKNTVGLFYYSGHGVQVNGKNYIVPIDSKIQNQDELRYLGVSIDMIMNKMENSKNKKNIIILDACRNNPFFNKSRRMEKGLATIEAQLPEFMIIYATAPGKVAGDNPSGRNGFFTASLLRYIRKQELELDQMVKLVTAETTRLNPDQIPWRNSSMTSDFYFNNTFITENNSINNKRKKRNSSSFPGIAHTNELVFGLEILGNFYTEYSSVSSNIQRSYSSIFGLQVGYAYNFTNNLALKISIQGGKYSFNESSIDAETDNKTEVKNDYFFSAITGIRYLTNWPSPVNVFLNLSIGGSTTEPAYVLYKFNAGIRVALQTWWIIDIGGAISQYLWMPTSFFPIFTVETGFVF